MAARKYVALIFALRYNEGSFVDIMRIFCMAATSESVRRERDTARLPHRKLSQQREYESVNAEALKGILSYLKYLYTEDEISDEVYRVLVSQVLSTFVENTISLKIERVFEDIDFTLEKASEALLMNMLD